MKKLSGFLVVAMFGVSALGAGAHAHTQSAMAGHGWPNVIDPCFATSWAQVLNTCPQGGSRLLIVPMQVPTSAGYYAFARVAGAPAYNQTSCQAMAIGPNNTGWTFSYLRTSSGSAPQTLTLSGIAVPPQGTAHFECQLGEAVEDYSQGGFKGGRVINVELR